MKALLALENEVETSGLERSLIELVKTGASQSTPALFASTCTPAMPASMVKPRRGCICSMPGAKRRLFRPRTRRAGLDRSGDADLGNPCADDVYTNVRAHFSDAETVNLTMLIATINAWNRLAISFRAMPPIKVRANAA